MIDFNNTQIAFQYLSNYELIKTYQIYRLINLNWLVNIGTKTASAMINNGLKFPVVLGMRPTIYSIFCGGETLSLTQKKIDKLYQYKVHSILDYGVEAKETTEDFDKTMSTIIDAIQFASKHQAVKQVCSKFTGLIPSAILKKLHYNIDLSTAEKKSYQQSIDRINNIAATAHQHQVSLFIDAEESWYQNPLDDLAYQLMLKYNKDYPLIYNTVQCYLKSRITYFKNIINKSIENKIIYGVKLVRGAYMEKEAQYAKQNNTENPLNSSKAATDNDYNRALQIAVENINHVAICVATHNEESTALMVQLMKDNKLINNHEHIYFSQLFGMSDNLSFNLAAQDYNATKYMPYGPVVDVIPYLIRRAQENTAVGGQMGRELQLLKKEIRRRKLWVL
ncbi:MAG: proline dehydrogenase family protein [Chitinophagales bacterium]|nr:proline dehydrogenase family protein [Chitinophagales bacterium]